jgi:hypothetical protein
VEVARALLAQRIEVAVAVAELVDEIPGDLKHS